MLSFMKSDLVGSVCKQSAIGIAVAADFGKLEKSRCCLRRERDVDNLQLTVALPFQLVPCFEHLWTSLCKVHGRDCQGMDCIAEKRTRRY